MLFKVSQLGNPKAMAREMKSITTVIIDSKQQPSNSFKPSLKLWQGDGLPDQVS